MGEQEILDRIHALVEEEHELSEQASRETLDAASRERRRHLEEALDQCWDLLRRRRARQEFGLDPDELDLRDVDTVEHYQQ